MRPAGTRQRNGKVVDREHFSRPKQRELTEYQERQLTILEDVGFTRARVACIPTYEVHLDQICFFGQPDRGLLFGTHQPLHVMEPRFDLGMPVDGNRYIHILGNHESGLCIGFEQVRDFGTRNQDSRLPENWGDCAKRSQKACSEIHSGTEVYAPWVRGAIRPDHSCAPASRMSRLTFCRRGTSLRPNTARMAIPNRGTAA